MEINSNSRNKPTANWISNKNAIASNNVSFVSNVVRRFHWLLKNSLPSPHWACLFFFLRHFVCCFYSSSFSPHCLPSAWWLATCRSTNHSWSIPPDERFVSEGPRRRIWSAIFPLHSWKKMQTLCYFYTIVAYHLYASVVFDVWILLCNAASSHCSPRCYSDSEKKKISRADIFWLDVPVVSLQTGGSDSVQCYEA